MDKHLSLSFELIYLMGWLLKHEKGMLNSLIKHALKNGLAEDLEKIHLDSQTDASQELQATILEFLAFLERALAKNLDASLETSSTDRQDTAEIKTRLERAKQLLSKELSSQQEKNQKTDDKAPKKSSFNQVLKNWKPSKNDLVH